MTLDVRKLAADWITIWQSELTAAAHDHELSNGYTQAVDQWALAAQTAATFLLGLDDVPAGRTWTGASSRTPAAPLAPDARDAAIRELGERVAELERIIAGLRTPA